MPQKPIFEYLNYRDYLRDFYAAMKQQNSRYSYRTFARMAGIKGYTLLRLVINNQRNLSHKTIRGFAKALGLKGKESSYFENLVLFNQAKKGTSSEHYFEELTKLTEDKKINRLTRDECHFFSKPFYPILREMVSLHSFCEDPAWIRRVLNNTITATEIKEAIATLIQLGLLKRDKTGKLRPARGTIKSIPDSNSIYIIKFHLAIMSMAREAILKVKKDQRESVTLTIPMTRSLIPQIKEKLRTFLEEIALLVNRNTDAFEEIYQVALQMFPVTHCTKRPAL